MSADVPDMYLDPLRSLAGVVHTKTVVTLPDPLRDVAARLVDLDDAGQTVRHAGVFGAHLLRLWGTDLLDQDQVHDGQAPAWAPVLVEASAELPPRSTATRYTLAGQLRHMGGGSRPQDEYGPLLAKWLVADPHTREEAATAAAYARRLLQHPRLLDMYAAGAWWSVFAWDLTDAVDLDKPSPTGGRPRSNDTTQHTRRALALGAYSARRWTKTAIAREAGISRPTLDTWLDMAPATVASRHPAHD